MGENCEIIARKVSNEVYNVNLGLRPFRIWRNLRFDFEYRKGRSYVVRRKFSFVDLDRVFFKYLKRKEGGNEGIIF